MGINNCTICLEKQRKIDELTEEIQRLRQALGRQKRKATDGLFGSSTPSSRRPVKANTTEKESQGKRGARKGHQGTGRQRGQGASQRPIVAIPP